jgi:outer membrane protein assembly factor BamB
MVSRRLRTVLQAAALAGLAATAHTAAAANITTYHYDNQRTGWNPSETALTPANVASTRFGLLHQVALDNQVDTQPLFVSGESIAGGTHDVVYVATESNTVYAIDAATGAILLSRNFGPPVPIAALPAGCTNNANTIGITGTPVIDTAAGILYVIVYTYENNAPIYRVHALALATLADTVPPVVIAATAPLVGGGGYAFTPASSRQRAALLETSGAIYAAFSSFCDAAADTSRGWVLGWQAGTLTPLAANELVDQAAKTIDYKQYLGSIWMSAAGIAADDQGSLYFVTSNSNAADYNSQSDLSESVVRISADLTTVQDFFTPRNHATLDDNDLDLGSGGILLLPDQPGAYPHLAIMAGKQGPLYLFNRDHLGGLAPTPPALHSYTNNGCWCAASYFVNGNGVPQIVTSTGQNIAVWKLKTSPSTALALASTGPTLPSGQDSGFFTTVSSNGQTKNTAVIWALPHPDNNDPNHIVTLMAFDPEKGASQLFSGAAGSWPFTGGNANLVPVVANGQVFVASYQTLSIFGLAPKSAHLRFTAAKPPVAAVYRGTPHQLYGTVVSLSPTTMMLRTRTGSLVAVDPAASRAGANFTELAPGHAALVRGAYDHAGNFIALFVMHAKDAPQLWGADR